MPQYRDRRLPQGEATVQTEGYAGSDCLQASKFLEGPGEHRGREKDRGLLPNRRHSAADASINLFLSAPTVVGDLNRFRPWHIRRKRRKPTHGILSNLGVPTEKTSLTQVLGPALVLAAVGQGRSCEAHIQRVVIRYEGCGDSGCIEIFTNLPQTVKGPGAPRR